MSGAKVQIERDATTEYVIVAFKFDSKDKADFALAASGRKKGSPPPSPPSSHARHGFVGPGGIIGCVAFLPLPVAVGGDGGEQEIKEMMISQLI